MQGCQGQPRPQASAGHERQRARADSPAVRIHGNVAAPISPLKEQLVSGPQPTHPLCTWHAAQGGRTEGADWPFRENCTFVGTSPVTYPACTRPKAVTCREATWSTRHACGTRQERGTPQHARARTRLAPGQRRSPADCHTRCAKGSARGHRTWQAPQNKHRSRRSWSNGWKAPGTIAAPFHGTAAAHAGSTV